MIWPDVSKIAGVESVMVTIAVQVNGKLRGTVQVSSEEAKNQDVVVDRAKQAESVNKWITGEVKKVVFVPGKLVNLVV